jgi:hypothetical protein
MFETFAKKATFRRKRSDEARCRQSPILELIPKSSVLLFVEFNGSVTKCANLKQF